MKNDDNYNPPADALEALARMLYPAMLSYFESEEGKREFAEWQSQKGGAKLQEEEVMCSEVAG